MELNSHVIERRHLNRQRTALRWMRDGGVVIAPETDRDDPSRLEFSETIALDVPLQVTCNLREVGRACKFLTDYAIYLWTCDQDGEYMLYGVRDDESHLNAELLTSSTPPMFKRIAAICYAGSHPNMQIDVYDARHQSTEADRPSLMSHILLPQGICAVIYQNNPRTKFVTSLVADTSGAEYQSRACAHGTRSEGSPREAQHSTVA